MTELKVIVSPYYFEEELTDEVTGLTFRKGYGVEVYSISLEENKLSGIQGLLRKNFLLPYDRATLEFVNGKNIAKEEVKVEAPVKIEEPVKEELEVELETKEVKKEVKKPRKSTKKESK
jgi:hypothetical protein